MERPTVDQYFIEMTHLVKARGTCPRRQVGAVVVKDKRVLTTGYNGAPRNFEHPCDTGCIRDELEIPSGMMADVCPCLHAEQNAIIQAATTGVSIEGADIYCTTQPCTQCSRMIANCGIRRVVFEQEYADPLSIGLLVTAGVELWKWDAAKKAAHPYGRSNTFEQARDALRRGWKAGDFAEQATKHQDVSKEIQARLNEERAAAGATAAAVGQDAADLPRTRKGGGTAGGGGGGDQGGTADDGPSVKDDEPADAGAEVSPEATGIRDLARSEERDRIIREMARTREERIQKALSESKK